MELIGWNWFWFDMQFKKLERFFPIFHSMSYIDIRYALITRSSFWTTYFFSGKKCSFRNYKWSVYKYDKKFSLRSIFSFNWSPLLRKLENCIFYLSIYMVRRWWVGKRTDLVELLRSMNVNARLYFLFYNHIYFVLQL